VVNSNVSKMDAEDGQRQFRITNKKTSHTREREELGLGGGGGGHIRLEEVQAFLKAFLFLVCSAH
jgi:hypothetical protein